MNLKKLTALLFAGVTAATPFATNAQNPTILQGNYISNVFGQANFVLNPNAQTNVANVTLSNATATRSTTTPLVATSEWNVTITSANGTAAWATRTFDAGMKNQNCEARFTYRGFQATSKAQIKQGANVVAELVLTPSATDPRIASINFPCGDLSSATTFVITDTATLAGTNEIGGIYVGLATNQANVAQAETVLTARRNTALTIPYNTPTTIPYNLDVFNLDGSYNTSTGVFTAKKSGKYLINAQFAFNNQSWTTQVGNVQILKNGSLTYRGEFRPTTGTYIWQLRGAVTVDLTVGDTIEVAAYYGTTNIGNIGLHLDSSHNALSISRFPSASELVVTPETQNVWGSAYWTATSDWTGTSTSEIPVNYSTWGTPTVLGSASIPSSSCGLTSGDIGFCIDTLPPGTYQVDTNLQAGVTPSTGGDFCYYNITVGGSSLSDTSVSDTIVRANVAGSNAPFSNVGNGVLNVTSLQKNVKVILKYRKLASATQCIIRSDASPTGYKAKPTITIKPLDNNANSALYVQGPVKSAGTGTAIPSGYVGEEVVLQSTSASSLTCNNQTLILPGSVTLQPGVWLVQAQGYRYVNQTVPGLREANLAPSTDTVTTWTNLFSNDAGIATYSNPSNNVESGWFTSRLDIKNVTTPTTLYLKYRCVNTSSVSILGMDNNRVKFIRIN